MGRRLKTFGLVWAVLLAVPASAAAEPTIISGPDGDTAAPFTTTNTQPVFVFSENGGALVSNQCRVTQNTASTTGWVSCSPSPGSFTSPTLTPGIWTFQVRSHFLNLP